MESYTETSLTLSELQAELVKHFSQEYHAEPKWFAAAPGRVNLIGEHVDYNDGFVLPMAIDRYAVIAAAPWDGVARADANLHSVNLGESARIKLQPPIEKLDAQWPNYIQGVISGGIQRGWNICPLNMALISSIPLGGGLSSSAAIEVAAATLLESIVGINLPQIEKALLCQEAEHKFAGVPCGIMDQFSSTLCRADHLMLLDCKSQDFEHVPFASDEVQVVIANSNVQHDLASGVYADRRRECEEAARRLGSGSLRGVTMQQVDQAQLADSLFRRARHVVTEIQRTVAAAEALRREDFITLGQLMDASHASLRSDYEVSCSELDCLVDIAGRMGIDGGVYGSRMTGGGFGGCTVSLVKTTHVRAFCEELTSEYAQRTGIAATVFATRPVAGTRVLE